MEFDHNWEPQQIEADVVIELISETGFGRTCPLWECEENTDKLRETAAQLVLAFFEVC